MRIHQLSPLDAVASLKSAAEGLGDAEVERRLQEYGRNGVEEAARRRLWLRLLGEFITFLSLIVWVATGPGFFAEWSDSGHDMAKVGCAIVTVILVNRLFSFWQEYRIERTLAALRKLLSQQTQVLREGKVTRVPAKELVPGDMVHLRPADNIPADCRLIEAFGVRVNSAAFVAILHVPSDRRGPDLQVFDCPARHKRQHGHWVAMIPGDISRRRSTAPVPRRPTRSSYFTVDIQYLAQELPSHPGRDTEWLIR